MLMRLAASALGSSSSSSSSSTLGRSALGSVAGLGGGARSYSPEAAAAAPAAAPEAGADTSTALTNPFHDACERGDAAHVESVLRGGAVDVNAGDPQRAHTTPLHLAARRGFVGVVRLLLAHGAEVDARGAWDLTPLMYTSVFDQPAVASVLLRHGADAALVDKKGKTAMDHALGEKNLGVVAALHQYRHGNDRKNVS